MFDGPGLHGTLERARGSARVALGPRGLERLAQAGSAKAMLPRVHGAAPEVVFLNTAGGLTGGDRMAFALALGPGASAVGTTQTAERVYRSCGGAAAVEVALDLAPGADLAWLPQETILFEGAALDRRTTARLRGDARLLLCEMVVLGRAAMGETVAHTDCRDRREVLRDGRPELIEPLRLTDAVLARAGGAAMLTGARALATVALVAPGAEDAVGPVRAVLGPRAAASGWNGKCVVRLLAPGARELRRAVAAVLEVLGPGRLPRVWAMGGT
jgi:urease accessory protein